MLGLPSLHHNNHVAIFILTIFLLKTKDINSINKMMLCITKNRKPIISSVRYLGESSILYKYRVALLVFNSILLSYKIMDDTKKF
jgi:hypothetical protein